MLQDGQSQDSNSPVIIPAVLFEVGEGPEEVVALGAHEGSLLIFRKE